MTTSRKKQQQTNSEARRISLQCASSTYTYLQLTWALTSSQTATMSAFDRKQFRHGYWASINQKEYQTKKSTTAAEKRLYQRK